MLLTSWGAKPRNQGVRHFRNEGGNESGIYIRQACTSRLLNMVGFFRQYGQIFNDNSLQNECLRSIQIGEVFFHSACFECGANRKDAALRAILRAFNNGFTGYEAFEEKVGATPAGKEVVRNPEYQKWRRKIVDTRGREEV